MKVVLDANIVVSFLLSKGFIISSIFEYFEKGRFKLLISSEIMLEYNLILQELVRRKLIDERESSALMNKINKKATMVNVISKLSVSKDKKDNRYLECSLDGKADYLVTRDEKHLYGLDRYKYTKIISALELKELLQSLDYSF